MLRSPSIRQQAAIFQKILQTPLPSDERKMDNGEAKVPVRGHDGQYLVAVSEFRELSPNSRVVTEGSGGRQKKQHTRPVCIGEPSEYSRDWLGVGNNVSVPNFSWFKSMSQIVGFNSYMAR